MPDPDTGRTYVREPRTVEPAGPNLALIVGGLVVAVGFILWLVFGNPERSSDGTPVPASETTNITVEPSDQPADTTTNVTIEPAPDAAPDAAVEDPAAPPAGTGGEPATPPAEP